MSAAARTGALVAVLALVAAWAIRDAERRGEAKAQARALEVRVETLRVEAARADTVYRDSLRIAVRVRERWDTVRTRDTVRLNDTLYVPLAAADSAVSSCFAAVRACGRAGAAKDSVIAALDARIAAMPKPPGPVRVWGERALWAAAGYGLGALFSGR